MGLSETPDDSSQGFSVLLHVRILWDLCNTYQFLGPAPRILTCLGGAIPRVRFFLSQAVGCVESHCCPSRFGEGLKQCQVTKPHFQEGGVGYVTCALWSPCEREEGRVTSAHSVGKASETQGVGKKAIWLPAGAHGGLLTAHQVPPTALPEGRRR